MYINGVIYVFWFAVFAFFVWLYGRGGCAILIIIFLTLFANVEFVLEDHQFHLQLLPNHV